ncbi:flagellar filament capping protein FliD [Pantoea dispersa]|jgi:flagellar hook-associated protein 2|uniref:flagellar filament capping protein FliD n=1 Tax=Pantoea dispersa TaxID=59814 RepID=UPI0021B0259B|nr:flagellar filament capping protein FliD [Pantoea dispersa]MCT6588425.1 flagellar filament capping protein FliD [Pantoea dispersa]
MAGFSSLGIGSGIDTGAMLEQIQQAELTRLKPYATLQTNYQGKISAWGQISSALDKLKDSVKGLTDNGFSTLTPGKNDAFTVTLGKGASANTHKVVVHELAAAHKLATAGQEKKDQLLGGDEATRTLTITTGDGEKLDIELSKDETSLEQIAKKINNADGDVTASVQRTDDGYQLVLTAKKSGEDGRMSVAVTGDDKLDGLLNTDPNIGTIEEKVPAKNAELSVDGIKYTRSSNNISDIIDGVTLELKAKSKDQVEGEQLTLTKDNSAIKTTLKSFVEQYNALQKLVGTASKFDQDGAKKDGGGSNGVLMGDIMLRGMMSEIRTSINGVVGEGTAEVSSLADIGITIDTASGEMRLDEKKLDAAVADHPEAIGEMFMGRGEKTGIAGQLNAIFDQYLGDGTSKDKGAIKLATDGLDEQVKRMQEQIDRTQALIDKNVERYRQQFIALEKTMAQMNSMSNQLSSVIATL